MGNLCGGDTTAGANLVEASVPEKHVEESAGEEVKVLLLGAGESGIYLIKKRFSNV